MTVISHSGPVEGLFGSLRGSTTTLVAAWIAAFRRRRQKLAEEEELRALDPRTLRDIGVEFSPELSPSLFREKTEAIALAANIVAGNLPSRRHRS